MKGCIDEGIDEMADRQTQNRRTEKYIDRRMDGVMTREIIDGTISLFLTFILSINSSFFFVKYSINCK